MAVTLEEISGWLDKQDYNYKAEEEKIVLATSNDESRCLHIIKARDEGCIFEWNMVIVDEENESALKVKEHQHLQTLLAYLLQMNYTTKFGTWEYDPKDGEIAFNVEIPLEDATMTFKQFERICGMTMDTSKAVNDIKHILETGAIPEDNSDEEMLAMLESMLARLKSEVEEEEAATADGI